MAVHSHALWSLQRSGDIREVSGDSPARSHVRFMPRVFGQRDGNRQHILNLRKVSGRAIAQAVSRRLPTMAARV
jgi:hypothetical protein